MIQGSVFREDEWYSGPTSTTKVAVVKTQSLHEADGT